MSGPIGCGCAVPTAADTGASCEPSASPKPWTFGDEQQEQPHRLGRELREAFLDHWHGEDSEGALGQLLPGLDRAAAKALLSSTASPFLSFFLKYDELPEPERGAWDAAAKALYEHGKMDAKEELEEKAHAPGWASRVGGRW
jgi:hypothetical protein